MVFRKEAKEKVLLETTFQVHKCLEYTMDKIEREHEENGEFLSIEDFIRRMLKANLDIHAFTVLSDWLPMEFPGDGDETMLRQVLALMGYDPEYTAAPDIEVYPLSHWNKPGNASFLQDWDDPELWDDEDPDELPFN